MKEKFFKTAFGGNFGTSKFDKKSSFCTLLGFEPIWDYKPTNATHADRPVVHTGDKHLNLSIVNEFHLKCDCINGSIINGVRHLLLYIFVLDKPSGYKVFCEPETIHYKKNKAVLQYYTVLFRRR